MVNQTQDIAAIERILTHPKVIRMIADDFTDVNTIRSRMSDGDLVGLHIMNEEKTGVIKVDPLNGITCVIHVATLPELWGKTREFAAEVGRWIFENTKYTKVVAIIPAFNRLTIKLCLDCGFVHEGTISQSFLKNWKKYDQALLGLTKVAFEGGALCHH